MTRNPKIVPGALLLFVTFVVVIAVSLPLDGHAIAGVFDYRNPIAVTGSITKVDLVYPDSFVHVRVVDPATGEVRLWAFMTLPPDTLKGIYHLDASILKEGEKVTVTAWPEIAGANSINHVQDLELLNRLKNEQRAFATQFEFSDGQKFRVLQLVVARLIQ